jgi:hypothetical protein
LTVSFVRDNNLYHALFARSDFMPRCIAARELGGWSTT